jgi:hypothetical protein
VDKVAMSYNYRITEFLDAVTEKDLIEIIRLGEEEVYSAERGISGVKGAKAKRASGASEYAATLKGFLFFLKTGVKPFGVNEEDFQRFQPVIKKLVDKKIFKPEILDVFKMV